MVAVVELVDATAERGVGVETSPSTRRNAPALPVAAHALRKRHSGLSELGLGALGLVVLGWQRLQLRLPCDCRRPGSRNAASFWYGARVTATSEVLRTCSCLSLPMPSAAEEQPEQPLSRGCSVPAAAALEQVQQAHPSRSGLRLCTACRSEPIGNRRRSALTPSRARVSFFSLTNGSLRAASHSSRDTDQAIALRQRNQFGGGTVRRECGLGARSTCRRRSLATGGRLVVLRDVIFLPES